MGRCGSWALVFLGLLAYCNAIHHPFVHDDIFFILKNPHINELKTWYEAFYLPASTGGINTYYRPILEVLYRLEYHFFGFNPSAFHLFNIIVHILNGLLLFRLLQKLGFAETTAWVVALFFLIHPLQTEAVSCISGISNLWMALFVLLALNAYLDGFNAISFGLFVVAFLSKEQGILFLPLVIVLDLYRRQKKWRSWFFWILSIGVLLWLRHCMTGVSPLKESTSSLEELYLRLEAIPRDLGMYLRLIFFPYDLHYYRSTDILQSNALAWAGTCISALSLFYILKRWPKTRHILFLGLGWFLSALLPVLNIAPLINEYSFILTAEHFLYLPIVGILIIVVSAVDAIPVQAGIFKKYLLGMAVVVCLSLTWYQNTFWQSEIVLFERMLQYEPNFGRGHLLLAKAYYFNGEPQQADGHYSRALSIMSGYVKKVTNETAKEFYLTYMSEILFDWAQNDGAMGHWGRALDRLNREAVIDPRNAAMYNNMAFMYLHLGDKKDARISFEHALAVDHAFTQARQNLQALGR